jgi:hypothetical protein
MQWPFLRSSVGPAVLEFRRMPGSCPECRCFTSTARRCSLSQRIGLHHNGSAHQNLSHRLSCGVRLVICRPNSFPVSRRRKVGLGWQSRMAAGNRVLERGRRHHCVSHASPWRSTPCYCSRRGLKGAIPLASARAQLYRADLRRLGSPGVAPAQAMMSNDGKRLAARTCCGCRHRLRSPCAQQRHQCGDTSCMGETTSMGDGTSMRATSSKRAPRTASFRGRPKAGAHSHRFSNHITTRAY